MLRIKSWDINATHYILTRSDLPVGFLAAQIIHSACESITEPHTPGTFVVVLDLETEQNILAVAEQLTAAKIPHTLIREPDAPWNGQATALGIFPVIDRAPIKKILSKFPLLGKRSGRVVGLAE